MSTFDDSVITTKVKAGCLKKIALTVAFALCGALAGRTPQAAPDLAACKSDLARAQADVTTARAAQTAAETRAAVKEAVEKADVKAPTPAKDMTTQQKAKAAGF